MAGVKTNGDPEPIPRNDTCKEHIMDITRTTEHATESQSDRSVYVRGKDGSTYVISPEILEAFSLSGMLLITVGEKSYAIPQVVVEQQPVSADDRADVEDVLNKQELPNPDDGEELWNLVPYTACFYGAWAGGGSAVAAGNYCEARYPF